MFRRAFAAIAALAVGMFHRQHAGPAPQLPGRAPEPTLMPARFQDRHRGKRRAGALPAQWRWALKPRLSGTGGSALGLRHNDPEVALHYRRQRMARKLCAAYRRGEYRRPECWAWLDDYQRQVGAESVAAAS